MARVRTWGMTEQEWSRATDSLRALLIEAASTRSTVTYGEIARRVFGGRFSARSGALMDLLGAVDAETDAALDIMIASLVVRADTGMPGEGYFAFVTEELGRVVDDRVAFWRTEAEKVYDAFAPAPGEAR